MKMKGENYAIRNALEKNLLKLHYTFRCNVVFWGMFTRCDENLIKLTKFTLNNFNLRVSSTFADQIKSEKLNEEIFQLKSNENPHCANPVDSTCVEKTM